MVKNEKKGRGERERHSEREGNKIKHMKRMNLDNYLLFFSVTNTQSFFLLNHTSRKQFYCRISSFILDNDLETI